MVLAKIRLKHIEIGVYTSTSMMLIILNTSKLRPKYMVIKKKIEKNYLLHGFSIQTPESLPFIFVDKNSLRTNN